MPGLPVPKIETAGVSGTNPLHGFRQVGFIGFQQQMVMIAHQLFTFFQTKKRQGRNDPASFIFLKKKRL
jgi:hypothetical protein